jgi:competence protein ComEC
VRTPAALAAVPLLIGSTSGLLLWDRLPDDVALCSAGAALISWLAALGAFGQQTICEATYAITLGCALAGLSLGVSAAGRAYRPPLLTWFEARGQSVTDPVHVEGILREDASSGALGPSLTLDVEQVHDAPHLQGQRRASSRVVPRWTDPCLGGVRLAVAGALAASHMPEWRGGRRIRVAASLRLPPVYLNPGVRDDRRALARKGIVLVGSIKSAALVETLERGTLSREAAAAVRASIRADLAAAVGRWSRRSAGIATAILIGDRTGLAEEDVRLLQEAGTYHVIAISGGNIAILTILLYGTMRLGRVPPRAAAVATMIVLLFYGRVAISTASVDRAITAAVVYLGARVIDQRGAALNVLSIAAVEGLAVSPVAVFDAGFLLSFAATLGILVGIERQHAIQSRHSMRPGALSQPGFPSVGRWFPLRAALTPILFCAGALLLATVAAEAALLPIAAALFGRITFAGLLLNFAAIPLMTIVQAGSLAALVVGPLHRGAAAAIGFAVHAAADALVRSSRLVEAAPWLSHLVAPPAWWLVAAYYVSLLLCLTSATGRVRRLAAGVAVIITALFVISPSSTSRTVLAPPSLLRVVFLDVGQGDATLILVPGGRAVLVDAGGIPTAQSLDASDEGGSVFDVGERVVVPALRALGVRRLDALVVTHGDPDHIGGARAVVRMLHVRSVWEGIPVPPHAGLRALAIAAEASGATWRTLQAGDIERFGSVVMRVLHPPPPEWERQRVRNEDSVGLEIRIGNASVILPGDIGHEGERAILSRLDWGRLVILKAPHHGSVTSSTPQLLGRLRPAAVVFSAGRANRFGHPHPTVVARYEAIGAHIFSTAQDGAVILDVDDDKIVLRGWTGKEVSLEAVR